MFKCFALASAIFVAIEFSAIFSLRADEVVGCPNPSYLQEGNECNRVVELQRLLSIAGYFGNRPNGYYGPLTRQSVEEFQRNNGLIPNGIAGPATIQTIRQVVNSQITGGRRNQ